MQHREVKAGIRFFICHACDYEWKEPCRDAATLSSSECPSCNTMTMPHSFDEIECPIVKKVSSESR